MAKKSSTNAIKKIDKQLKDLKPVTDEKEQVPVISKKDLEKAKETIKRILLKRQLLRRRLIQLKKQQLQRKKLVQLKQQLLRKRLLQLKRQLLRRQLQLLLRKQLKNLQKKKPS